MSRGDLTDAFGTSARSNLSDLLPPRQRRSGSSAPQSDTDPPTAAAGLPAAPPEADPSTSAVTSPAEPSEPSTDRAAEPVEPGGEGYPDRVELPADPGATTPDGEGTQPSYQTSIYVLPELRDAVAARRRGGDPRTNAEFAFDAIDDVQDQLSELLRARRSQPRPDSSLFPPRIRANRQASNEARRGRVLWTIRATGEELDVIDKLVDGVGADSRSELVAVALEACFVPNRARSSRGHSRARLRS
jgi:hypothetical protein